MNQKNPYLKSRSLIKFIVTSSLLLVCQLSSLKSQAQERSPVQRPLTLDEMVKDKKYLKNSVYFHILPKGFQFFNNNIYNLISNQTGLQIEENVYPPQEFVTEPISTEKLIGSSEENKILIKKIRNFIGKWFSGMALSDTHQFVIKLGNISYQTKFTKSSVYLDNQLLKLLNKNSGAVLVLELQAQKLALFSDSIRIKDNLNPIFQTLGFNGLQVLVNNKNSQQEIKFRVPFFVEIDKDSKLKFQIIKFNHNLNDLNINYKYKKIITGHYKIITTDEFGENPQVVEFNSTPLKEILESEQALIISELRKSIVDFTDHTLVELLNKEINKTNLDMSFADIISIPEPKKFGSNVEPVSPKTPPEALILGLKLNSKFGQSQQDGLQFYIDTYIEDLKNPKLQLPASFNSAPPQIDKNNSDLLKSDAVLALDLNLANRILQILHNRNYFTNVNQISCDGKPTWITIDKLIQIKPPSIKPTTVFNTKTQYKIKNYDFVQTRVSMVVPVPKDQAQYFNGPIHLSTDILLRLQANSCKDKISVLDKNKNWIEKEIVNPNKTCLEIYLDRPLIETLKIEKTNFGLLARLFSGKVEKEIKKTLLTSFQPCPGSNETPLLENLPIPPQFFGIGFDILNFNVDKNGHLIFFLNIKNTSE